MKGIFKSEYNINTAKICMSSVWLIQRCYFIFFKVPELKAQIENLVGNNLSLSPSPQTNSQLTDEYAWKLQLVNFVTFQLGVLVIA